MDKPQLGSALPDEWVLVFYRSTDRRWLNWLACGRYKHVAAVGYVKATRQWLFYNVTLAPTLLLSLPDGEAAVGYFHEFTRDADLMRIAPRQAYGFSFMPMTCVTAIKRLIGLKSRALRPSAFYRDCLAAGGKPLEV